MLAAETTELCKRALCCDNFPFADAKKGVNFAATKLTASRFCGEIVEQDFVQLVGALSPAHHKVSGSKSVGLNKIPFTVSWCFKPSQPQTFCSDK